MIWVLAVTLCVAAGAALFAGLRYYYDRKAPNFGAEYTLYVYPDTGAEAVLDSLTDRAEARRRGSLERCAADIGLEEGLKPGKYVVKPDYTAAYVVRMLVNGWQTPQNLTLSGTIRSKGRLADIIGTQMMVDSASVVSALEDGDFLSRYGFTPETVFALFLPDTYQMYWTASVPEIFGRFKKEYDAFWQALATAQEAEVHGFEDAGVFEGCMPVEVMARRGRDTLCYGPLKPVGLKDPRTGKEPFAVVQLRTDNAQGSIYNIVGFQTHLKWPEQKRVFSMIPALKNAEYVRYGVMHRNTFLDSPRLLDRYYRVRTEPRVRFAGQITGVEGYVESTASGCLAAMELARELQGKPPIDFPQETAMGALALYISEESVVHFQPMNVNFGLIPPLGYRVKGKRNMNAELSTRALEALGKLDLE